MADIAILVAEEYERRIKNPRKDQGFDDGKQDFDLVSGLSISANSLKMQNGTEIFKWIAGAGEPKSQVGLAAASGFFSA